MRLEGKVIVVTGGSLGIGKAMADAFVEEGATVVIASRTESTVREVASELNEKHEGGEAVAVPTDIRSERSIAALFESVREECGLLDVLVNNAAVSQRTLVDGDRLPVAKLPVEVWDTIVETNLRGTFLCTQFALREMLERDAGKIIHISSRGGERARAKRGAYAPSKFGVEALHECLAEEIGDTNVSTLVLRPPQGGTATGEPGSRTEAELESMYPPSITAETAVRLAACEGRNGGRYVPTPDGQDYIEWPRRKELPPDHPDRAN